MVFGLLSRTWYGNTLQDLVTVLAMVVGGMLLIGLLRRGMLRAVRKRANGLRSNVAGALVDATDRYGIPVLHLAVLQLGLGLLLLPHVAETFLRGAFAAGYAYLVVRALSLLVRRGLHGYLSRHHRAEEKLKQVGGLTLLIDMVLYLVGLLFLFNVLGYNVTTIVAGLGIGGIAVALAAQNILGDLFNYFVIFFDRPFEVGDFIVVDQESGTIEYIGVKTTRVKALSGEQIIFANSDLTGSRIHNYKRMERRRVVLKFSVAFGTTLAQLQRIPGTIRTIMEQQSPITFDRAHVIGVGDHGFQVEAVYFVLSPDYAVYINIHQTIILALVDELSGSGVRFAVPVLSLVDGTAAPERHSLQGSESRMSQEP